MPKSEYQVHANEGKGPQKYKPSRGRLPGVALALSGGGFRAALFHLGGLRRLNELGVLSKVEAISAVSGGSIFAAHLVTRVREWPIDGMIDDWEKRVAQPFREFCSSNLRTIPVILQLVPFAWKEALARAYRRRLTQLKFRDLPARPNLIFCATDLSFGANWTFTKKETGDYLAGYAPTDPEAWVADAVAASSRFPPVFRPRKAGLNPGNLTRGKAKGVPHYDRLVQGLRLTDGGVYDNLGLEPVWKHYETVLASDGGATFDYKRSMFWNRILRYADVAGNQALAIRKRWLIASFENKDFKGTYWGIGTDIAEFEKHNRGYPKQLVDDVISEVRTDMDAFSQAEIQAIENQGYLLADGAIRTWAPQLIAKDAAGFAVPHPKAMDPDLVSRELTGSHKRHWLTLGRW